MLHFVRRGIVFALLIAVAGQLSADDQPEGDRLLFELNYDNWSMTATHAEGNPECLSFANPDLQLRMYPGINGKGGGLLLSNSEHCRYALAKNFNPARGTVSLWIAPGNWKPSQKRYQRFFEVKTDAYRVLIQKNLHPYLMVYLKYEDAPGTKNVFVAKIRIEDEDWPAGKWHKVDVTWDRTGMQLYLDGRLPPKRYYRLTKEAPTVPTVEFSPEFELPERDGTLVIGSAGKHSEMSDRDQTAFDEVRIYNYPLTAAQIRRAYEAHIPSTFGSARPRHRMTVPPATQTVELDGRVGPEEWADAVRVPVAAMGRNPRRADAWAYVKHDGESVYLAVQTDQPPAKRRWTETDGNIWEDDSCEFFLSDGTNTYHLIVNANGALFDEKGVDKEWNSGAESAAEATEAGWSVELRIPAAALGGLEALRTTPWRGNICLSYWDGITLTLSGWSQPIGRYSNAAAFGDVRFIDKPGAVRIESLGQLDGAGRLDLLVTLAAEAQADRIMVKASCDAEGMAAEALPGNAAGRRWQRTFETGRKLLAIVATREGESEPLFIYTHPFLVSRPLQLAYNCRPSLQRIEAELTLTPAALREAKGEEAATPGRLLLTDPRDGRILSTSEADISRIHTRIELPLPPDLEPGAYELAAAVGPDGPNALTEHTAFRVPEMTPFHTAVIEPHAVPSPWTPIERVAETAFGVWGRTYAFERGPFPQQVTSQGDAMLAVPPALHLELGNGPAAVTWTKNRTDAVHPDRVELSGAGTAADDALRIEWNGTLHFDGVYELHLTMNPAAGPVEIRSLRLAYALPRAFADYVLSPLYSPWEDDRVALRFTTDMLGEDFMVWVTGFEKGFFWWPRNDANWVNGPDEKQVVISRNDERADIDIGIITRPATLDKIATYTMAFMGSPAKHPPAEHRHMHFTGWGRPEGQNAQSICWNWARNEATPEDMTSCFSYRMVNPDGFRRVIDGWLRKGIASFPYAMPGQISTQMPEYDYFLAEWELIPGHLHRLRKRGEPFTVHPCCAGFGEASTGIDEFVSFRVAEMMDTYQKLGGIYYDVCRVRYCENRLHGCGGVDAFGKPYRSSNALGMREILRKVYTVLHARDKQLINHAHSKFNPIAHNFSDYWFPGEQYCNALPKNLEHFYAESIPPEVYQSELNWRIKGVGMIFLPQYERSAKQNAALQHRRWEFRKDPEWAIRTITPLALNDLVPSANFIDADTVSRYWLITERLNIADAVFTPYWQTDAVGTDHADVKVSYHRWTGDDHPADALLIAGNLGREDAAFALSLDAAKLGLEANRFTLHEYWNDTALSIGDLEHLTLPSNHFLLIGIAGADAAID